MQNIVKHKCMRAVFNFKVLDVAFEATLNQK